MRILSSLQLVSFRTKKTNDDGDDDFSIHLKKRIHTQKELFSLFYLLFLYFFITFLLFLYFSGLAGSKITSQPFFFICIFWTELTVILKLKKYTACECDLHTFYHFQQNSVKKFGILAHLPFDHKKTCNKAIKFAKFGECRKKNRQQQLIL